MKKIHQLPQEVVSKIAAGEVIERPVYAVKELVENALDAGADTISVQVEESGLKRITVSDNGEGMSKEDVLESFKTHTTSKLQNESGLHNIQTLGFRGEALASIAAISKLTIKSRTAEETAGTSVSIKEGKVGQIVPIGMPVGTQVTIDYLFHSVPGRKKFLKSKRTEFRLIIELMTYYALAYPSVHFVLTHNNRTIFDFPKTNEAAYRIENLLGHDIYEGMVPVSYEDSYVRIAGFIARPPLTTRTPNKQYFFVNSRHIRDKGLSLQIKHAYGTLLESGVYPICLLSFHLPFELVDVNVHPRKEEVRFVDTPQLYEAVTRAVTQTLSEHSIVPQTSYWKSELFGNAQLHDAVGSTHSYAGKLLKEKTLPWELATNVQPDTTAIIQLHSLYLVTPTKQGLLLIDQHAAHERILYEQLQKEFTKERRKNNRFHLPKPTMFTLSLSETELLIEHLPLLKKLGWDIEQFAETTFLVRSLPALFQDRNYGNLLKETLEDIRDSSRPKDVDTVTQRMIAYLACRGAVKAGDRLTKKQAKDLVEQLAVTPNNATCPHGRPTRVLIEMERIHTLFKRK